MPVGKGKGNVRAPAMTHSAPIINKRMRRSNTTVPIPADPARGQTLIKPSPWHNRTV